MQGNYFAVLTQTHLRQPPVIHFQRYTLIFFTFVFSKNEWMKSLALLYSSFLILWVSVLSCTTDFELEADWQDIPVVYGFLSLQDTAHYIRVEKAFLQSGGDANQIAQIPDSLYYDAKVQVQLKRLTNGQLFTLQRVDGAKEGYPRQGGTFASVPNILYKIRASDIQLKAGEQIQFVINRGDNKPIVSAQTSVLAEIKPRESNPVNPLNLAYDRSINFAWDAPLDAKVFDLRLLIYYRESIANNPTQFVNKNLSWALATDLQRQDSTSTRVTFPSTGALRGEEFYIFLQNNLTPVSDRIRKLDKIDIQITGVGRELVEYLRIAQANTGITSAQELPVYTNLSEGRGIFSSKTTTIRAGLTLTQTSQDSLIKGIHTRTLNFQ